MASSIVLKGTVHLREASHHPAQQAFPIAQWETELPEACMDERRALYLPSAQCHYHSLELSTFTTATRPQNRAIPFASADPTCASLVKQLGQ